MTGNDLGDDDLRNRFVALRREEEAQAPECHLPSPRGERRVGRRFIGLAAIAGCLAMIALGVFLISLAQRKRSGQPVVSLTAWRAPTDFLLETPGRELLQSVPTIGEWHDYIQAPRPEQKRPRVRKRVLTLRRNRS